MLLREVLDYPTLPTYPTERGKYSFITQVEKK